MTTSPQNQRTAADRTRAAALWARDTGLGGFGFALVLTVALAGWSASFLGLHAFGAQHMALSDHAAWLVPLTFDGAPAGLSIVVMRASTHGRSAILWRLLIIGFTGLSSWINYEHIQDPLGRIVASFMPPAAVILFEGLMSEAREAAQRRSGRGRATIHPLRWFFDRKGTLDLHRQHILGLPVPGAMSIAVGAPQFGHDGAPADLVEAPRVAPAMRPRSAIPAATVAPQRIVQGATRGATVSLVKRPQGAIQSAPVNLLKRPRSAPTVAITAPPAAPPKRPAPATSTAPKAPRPAPTKRPKGDLRGAARDAIKALYTDLQRRPLESDMVAALKTAKLPHSRQFANARRLEIEKADPTLAALGSQNVRPLTGS